MYVLLYLGIVLFCPGHQPGRAIIEEGTLAVALGPIPVPEVGISLEIKRSDIHDPTPGLLLLKEDEDSPGPQFQLVGIEVEVGARIVKVDCSIAGGQGPTQGQDQDHLQDQNLDLSHPLPNLRDTEEAAHLHQMTDSHLLNKTGAKNQCRNQLHYQFLRIKKRYESCSIHSDKHSSTGGSVIQHYPRA